MTTYFDHLAARLRGEGVPDDQVGVIVADLATYLDDTGVQPDAEFGPVAEFAAQLAPPRGDGVPAQPPDGETWRWRADAFDEMRWLETFGDQGWEVERVDGTGRFVCRRDAEDPQRWEYRRDLVGRTSPEADLSRLEDELAPDGWEPCGRWVCFAYFKRPRAALIGPDAVIDIAPRRPARTSFFSRRFLAVVIAASVFAGVVVAAAVVGVMALGDRVVGGGFAIGALVGAVTAVAGVVTVGIVLVKRAGARADRE